MIITGSIYAQWMLATIDREGTLRAPGFSLQEEYKTAGFDTDFTR